jgi:endoglucanase
MNILARSIIVALAAVLVVNVYSFANTNKITQTGVHDPDDIFAEVPDITLSADYFAWNKDLNVIKTELQKSEESNRSFLVTVEPWPKPIGFRHKTNDDLLRAIISGTYDQTTKEICQILSESQSPVYIRWGHEMELGNSRYPWTNGTPELYILAYKQFVTICRTQSDSLKYVWSPAGEIGLEKYWPGETYVDYIGVSVYSFDEYELKYFNQRRSFKDVFDPIYQRVKIYNKPILISEMGVTGTDEYKINWLQKMRNETHLYKNLAGFVYLNTQDPQAVWEQGLSNPDWRLPVSSSKLLIPDK